MDEIERDEEDFSMDYLYDELGPQYAAEHAEEIAQDFQTSGVINAAIDSHEQRIGSAKAQIEKAKGRLGSGDWDEAVFHAARAIDGYLTQVFLIPFRTRILEPFRTAFPHMKISDNSLLGMLTGLESSAKFIYVGITATRDAKEAEALNGELRKLINEKGNWPIRNATFHTLTDPSEEQARAFVDQMDALLNRLAAPLDATVKAAAEQLAEVERALKETQRWRTR